MNRFPKIMFAVLVAGISSAYSDELGRLLFTPQQRMQLDRSYAGEIHAEGDDRRLVLSGIVQRNGGKRTAWINGVPQRAGQSDEHSPESMVVTLPGQDKPVRVKVGQRVLVDPQFANPGPPAK